jgi:acyl-CoA synthetase (NDP forming)
LWARPRIRRRSEARRSRSSVASDIQASIDELPEGIDAALLAVPAHAVASAVEACGRRGIGGVVVFASGFAEVDGTGQAAQRELAALARRSGLALAGPNCLGAVNFVDGVPLTFGAVEPAPVGDRAALGIVAQSGAMSFALLYAAQSEGIPLSYTISTGNEAVVGVEDYLAFLLADEHTRAVALLVEQIRRPERFLSLAAQARAMGKALCILHTGSSERGRQAARSHTGALAGDQAVIRALLRREAVVIVESFDELIDVAGVLTRCRLPTRDGLAFLTDSGALKSHALDVCDGLKIDLPEPTPKTEAALRALLPSFAIASNPVDITAQALNDPSLYGKAGAALLEDPQVGALVVAAMPGSPLQFAQQVDAMLPAVSAANKPVLYTVMGGQLPLPLEELNRIRAAGLPLFRSPERAMRAAGHLISYARTSRAAAERRPSPPGDSASLPAGAPLTEHRAKALLAAHGVPVPAGGVAARFEDALQITRSIGYPVVLKAQAASLLHKSDVGGVILGVHDDSALGEAWQRLHRQVRAARPDLAIEGVLVERMAPPGVELVVGARRDPEWGAVLLVGLGGVWIEVMRDVRLISAHADREEVLAELRQLRAWPLLDGARGTVKCDVEALADAVCAIARLVRDTPNLAELDVNPLIVLPAGQGVVALDAVFLASAPAKDA